MTDNLTVLALRHEATARALSKYQIDPAEMFRAAGLDPEPYRDPDSRLRVSQIRRLWEQCIRMTKNPCFAFEAGMVAVPANFHAVGYAWLASRNLREALVRLVRYHRLLTTAVVMTLEDHDGELDLLIVPARGLPQETIDALVASVVAMCRDITYDDYAPLRIEMMRAEPPCTRQLAKFFRCPIQFGAARNCVAFRRDQAEKFLPRQNPALARANDEVAIRYIAHMDRSDVLTRAKLALIDMLSNGEPTRAALADRLHMSERTLARRLTERGLSFRELLDAVRKDLGLGYMDESRYAVTDVAYLLGFSDQSNFARSFRRWTGQTPSQYRTTRRDGTSGVAHTDGAAA